jgi:hypothetical protein
MTTIALDAGCAPLLSTRALDRTAGSASNFRSEKSVPPWPTAAGASGAVFPPGQDVFCVYRFRQGDRRFMMSPNVMSPNDSSARR